MISYLVYILSLSVSTLRVFSSFEQCGQSSDCPVLPVALIKGGEHSCIESHPWSAFLVRADSLLYQSDLDIFCGASIITKNFLISAAHCFEHAPVGHSLTKEEIYIYVGLDNRVHSHSDKDWYAIEHFDIHPDWDNTGDVDEGNDIVIIKVKNPITFNPTVSKICLPSDTQTNLIEVGRDVRFAGFGKTSPSAREPPQTLQESVFNIIQCDAPNNICAAKVIGGRVTSSICSGDSGGGLIARENGFNYLVGVVSWNLGQLCNNSTQYVNVFKHLSWIQSVVEVCYSQKGTKCIFPFTFKGETHYECISPSPTDKTLATKCPTKLNRQGKISLSSFTHCSSRCPGFQHQVQPTDTTQVWRSWSSWSSCSMTCGSGNQKRSRTCSGENCQGSNSDSRICNANSCPVWRSWSSWSSCSLTCGSGTKARSRTCSGDNCQGSNSESRICNTNSCPGFLLLGGWNDGSKHLDNVEAYGSDLSLPSLPSLPLPLSAPIAEMTESGAVYVAGGWTGSSRNDKTFMLSSLSSSRWEELEARMPRPVSITASVVVKDIVLVLGGISDSGVSDAIQLLDTSKSLPTWKLLSHSKLPQPLELHSAAVFEGQVIIVTEQGVTYTTSVSSIISDTKLDWVRGELPGVKGTVILSHILVGGPSVEVIEDKLVAVHDTKVFTKTTMDSQWVQLEPLPQEKSGYPSIGSVRGSIVVGGGGSYEHGDYRATATVFMWVEASSEWEEVTSLKIPRHRHATIQLNRGIM